jgi:hypothetical protein
MVTMVFRSGKIYLKWLDSSNFDFPIDINDDGTLDTQYGELKKKGTKGLEAVKK